VTRATPILATWLLRHLNSSMDNDAVLGDLSERFQDDKTALWFWRQVAVAITISAFNDLWRHKLITLGAMIVGWPIFYFLGLWIFNLLSIFTTWWPPDWLFQAKIGSWSWLNHERFVALYWYSENALGSVLMLVIGVVPGWIISRLNRRHCRSIILLFSTTVLLSWIYYRWNATAEDIGGSVYWEAYFWMNTILQVVGILAGGLVELRPRYERRPKSGSKTAATAAPLAAFVAALSLATLISQEHSLTAQEDRRGGTIEGTVTLEGRDAWPCRHANSTMCRGYSAW
jgi:hypothetical protein